MPCFYHDFRRQCRPRALLDSFCASFYVHFHIVLPWELWRGFAYFMPAAISGLIAYALFRSPLLPTRRGHEPTVMPVVSIFAEGGGFEPPKPRRACAHLRCFHPGRSVSVSLSQPSSFSSERQIIIRLIRERCLLCSLRLRCRRLYRLCRLWLCCSTTDHFKLI